MIGSKFAMPILIINMGGEMMYILNQRLHAQNIPEEKSNKVLADVIRTMYTPVFLEELFKPQEVYSSAATKQIFDKLAHSSIMRLNKTSMDKLYDLMTMGVKFQLLSSHSPAQYLQITVRHLEGLEKMVGSNTELRNLLQSAIQRCIKLYTSLSYGEWLLLQQTLYAFFQGRKIKVSLFLQQNMQGTDGMLILPNQGQLPYLTAKPGKIHYYENNNVVRSDYFHSDLREKVEESDDVLALKSNLGKDLYNKSTEDNNAIDVTPFIAEAVKGFAKNPFLHPPSSSSSSVASSAAAEKTRHASMNSEILSSYLAASSKQLAPSAKYTSEASAKAEVSLLAELLGGGFSAKEGEKGEERAFKINLFPNQFFSQGAKGGDEGEGSDDKDTGGGDSNFIMFDIDAAADAKTLAKYMEDLDLKDGDSKAEGKDEDDLLDLMDSTK